VNRIARATCTELHTVALETGYLVRPRRDPGQYRYRAVWPIVLAACSTGLIAEVGS
jgi:hypothetical protein